MRAQLTLLFALALLGCAPRRPSAFSIAVYVESDPGVPLAGAQLRVQGSESAKSDASGLLLAELVGRAGDVVPIDVACPEGYRSPDKPLKALLRPLEERGKRPEFRVACAPLTRSVVVAVRAEHGPNLPLRYLGQEIARTDALGAAHALLTAAPGETLTLTLDTSSAAKLMPQQPELKVTLKERDEIVVFDQAFKQPKPPKPKVQKPPPPSGPQRI